MVFFGLFLKNYVSCLSKVLPFLLGQKALFESTICFSDLCICSAYITKKADEPDLEIVHVT